MTAIPDDDGDLGYSTTVITGMAVSGGSSPQPGILSLAKLAPERTGKENRPRELGPHEQLENLKVILHAFIRLLRGAAREARSFDMGHWASLRERAAELGGIRSALGMIESRDGRITTNVLRGLGDCAWSSVVAACEDLLAYEATKPRVGEVTVMSTSLTNVARLDFSKPPPGYSIGKARDGFFAVLEPAGEATVPGRRLLTDLAALTWAWDHYKARHNPPGMIVQWFARSSGGGEWTVSDPKHLIWYACYERRNDGGELVARGAAWNWYEVRLALAQKLDAMQTTSGRTIDMDWPRCLAWSDAEVAAVERWIAAENGEIEMPEVLRG